MTDLKYKSQSCNCGTLCDSLIRDQIVIDIKDDGLRQQLLHKTNLTLLKAVEIGQVHEMANSQLKSIQRGKASHEESAIIDSVKFKRNQNRDNSQRPQYNRYHNGMVDLSLLPYDVCGCLLASRRRRQQECYI